MTGRGRGSSGTGMMIVMLLGAPGCRQRHAGPCSPANLGLPIVATGDLFRAAVREGTPLGHEARRYMERGQLVPDDITVRMLLDRLDEPDAPSGARSSTASRAPARRPRRSTRARRARAAASTGRCSSTCPIEDLIRRLAGRRVCPANGHVYNVTSNPPHVPGICDLDGSPLIQREDDSEETSARGWRQQSPPLRRGRRPLPRSRRAAPVDGRSRSTRSPSRSWSHRARSTRRPDRLTWSPASPARDRARCAVAGRIVAEALALHRGRARARRDHRRARPDRRAPHPRRRARPRRSRTTSATAATGRPPHLPGQPVHLASTTRSSTASPASG